LERNRETKELQQARRKQIGGESRNKRKIISFFTLKL
jgi:hypothetical protein